MAVEKSVLFSYVSLEVKPTVQLSDSHSDFCAVQV